MLNDTLKRTSVLFMERLGEFGTRLRLLPSGQGSPLNSKFLRQKFEDRIEITHRQILSDTLRTGRHIDKEIVRQGELIRRIASDLQTFHKEDIHFTQVPDVIEDFKNCEDFRIFQAKYGRTLGCSLFAVMRHLLKGDDSQLFSTNFVRSLVYYRALEGVDLLSIFEELTGRRPSDINQIKTSLRGYYNKTLKRLNAGKIKKDTPFRAKQDE